MVVHAVSEELLTKVKECTLLLIRSWHQAELKGEAEGSEFEGTGVVERCLARQLEGALEGLSQLLPPNEVGWSSGRLGQAIINELRRKDVPKATDGEDVYRRIAARLLKPVRAYLVELPLTVAAAGQLRLSVDVGGPDQARIEAPSVKNEHRHVLHGQVSDVTSQHASRQFVSEARTLLGLFAATGVAELKPGPQTVTVRSKQPNSTRKSETKDWLPAAYFVSPDPDECDELSQARFRRGKSRAAAHTIVEQVGQVYSGESDRCKQLRSAAQLMAEAELSPESGRATAFALMALEALLLDGGDSASTMARLKEAVAFRLGRDNSERQLLRKEIDDLYDTRCRYVHTGRADGGKKKGKNKDRRDHGARGIDLAMRAFAREFFDLTEKE